MVFLQNWYQQNAVIIVFFNIHKVNFFSIIISFFGLYYT